jgi:hypothetical protein
MAWKLDPAGILTEAAAALVNDPLRMQDRPARFRVPEAKREYQMARLEKMYRTTTVGSSFYAEYSYAGRLTSGLTTEQKKRSDFLLSGRIPSGIAGFPVYWIDTASPESRTLITSYGNEGTAKDILELVALLVMLGIDHKDIQILCMYNGQRDIIQRSGKEAFGDNFTRPRNVDAFQGQEAKIIILDTTRSRSRERQKKLIIYPGEGKRLSQTKGYPPFTQQNSSFIRLKHKHIPVANEGAMVGFVKDEKRMNVAISRHRCILFIFGCHETLSVCPNWYQMAWWAMRNGNWFPLGVRTFVRYLAIGPQHWYPHRERELRTLEEARECKVAETGDTAVD